jgi:addiction module RelB/DinJ family antitoxin
MKTAIINIKTELETKQKAQKIAGELGFSLGSVLNAYLKKLVREKTINFSIHTKEEPSQWLINELKEAEKDEREGFVSPGFTNTKDLMTWLKNPKRKYNNGKTDYGNKAK